MLLVYAWWPTASRTPVALAHAFVIGSDPVDGSTVSSAPAVVRIFFNEAIGPGSVAHVFAPDGHVVDAAPSSISRTDPRELDTPLATPGSLPQGGYTVRWTALSDEDGHTTHGVIGFNVLAAGGREGPRSPGTRKGQSLDKSGTYDISYGWSTPSGTRKGQFLDKSGYLHPRQGSYDIYGLARPGQETIDTFTVALAECATRRRNHHTHSPRCTTDTVVRGRWH